MLERLLIVGLGSIGQRHLRLAREAAPGARIAVLRHRADADGHGASADHTIARLDDAVAFRPQAAVIASPSSHHLESAMALAAAGTHLLIEKPIANSARDVPELLVLCRRRRVVLMTGYNLRFLPSLRCLRELVMRRRVGRTLSVRAEVGQYLPTWRPQVDYRQTVSASAALGGGVLLELSHEIDYLRWLFGEVDWVSSTQRRLSNLEIDVEDTAHLVMGFTTPGAHAPVIGSLDLDFIRHDRTRCCTVIGEDGTLRWDALAGTVDCFDKGGRGWLRVSEEPVAPDETYRAEWREFLRCIATGEDPEPSGADGLAVLRVIEAARLSDSSGSVARVQHDDMRAGEAPT